MIFENTQKTTEERKLINDFKKKNKQICYYCSKNISQREDLTVDHKTPISRGGKTEESNMVIACLKCNIEKGKMTEEEYKLFKQKLLEIYEDFEVTAIVSKLKDLYCRIIERTTEVNNKFLAIENTINEIQAKILNSNFNASAGYLLAKSLKEAIKERDDLLLLKESYNILNAFIGNSRKQLYNTDEKVLKIVCLKCCTDAKVHISVESGH